MDPLKLAIADSTDKMLDDNLHNIRKEMGLLMQAGFDVGIGALPKAGRKYSNQHIFAKGLANTENAVIVRMETTVIFEPYVYDPFAHTKCCEGGGCPKCDPKLKGRGQRRGSEI